MGFTLRAALDELADDAHVTVAELNPVVVEWCEGPLVSLIASAATDPRVTMEIVDVAVCIEDVARRAEARRFDAIILDMYEGPPTHVRPADPLFGPFALLQAKNALAKNGVLAVWCEGPSIGFERSLVAAGFSYRIARPGRGARIHHVYIARKSADRPDRPVKNEDGTRGAARDEPVVGGASSTKPASRRPRHFRGSRRYG
jgi:hypothetical protein